MKSQDNKVLELFSKNYSVKKIAQTVGLSRQGVYNILQRNSINYKKASPSINPDILQNKLKNNSIRNVVDETGIPYHYIKRVMDNYNIEKREIMNEVLNVSDIERLYNVLGFSDEEIGKIFQCSQYTVRSFRWKHNIYNRNRQWQERLPKKVYLQLRKQKLSLSEISAVTDVPYYTVVKAKKLYE